MELVNAHKQLYIKRLTTWCNIEKRMIEVGHLRLKKSCGETTGRVVFAEQRFNALFPNIRVEITHHSDYDLITSDILSVISGYYDNLRMAAFIARKR